MNNEKPLEVVHLQRFSAIKTQYLGSLSFSENIQCVVGVTNHILSFTDGKVVFQIKFKHGIVHLIDGIPHMVGIPIGGNKVELCYRETVS